MKNRVIFAAHNGTATSVLAVIPPNAQTARHLNEMFNANAQQFDQLMVLYADTDVPSVIYDTNPPGANLIRVPTVLASHQWSIK